VAQRLGKASRGVARLRSSQAISASLIAARR
jgi:hypothetical protein